MKTIAVAIVAATLVAISLIPVVIAVTHGLDAVRALLG